MPRLSVVVITKNEAARIARCLRSVAWADERIVLDSGSDDDTVRLAREAGAQVHVRRDWPGFGPQKNRAIDLASGEWILVLDADEVVTEPLAKSLRAALQGPPRCYGLRRVSSFLGAVIRWGDWRNDLVWRLFPRGQARFDDAVVHERLDSALPRAVLSGELLHETYRTHDDVRRKSAQYAELGARQMHARGRRVSAFGAAPRAAWAWLRCAVLRLGLLDGRAGWQVAAMQAWVTYHKYRRLRALSRNPAD